MLKYKKESEKPAVFSSMWKNNCWNKWGEAKEGDPGNSCCVKELQMKDN